VRYRAPLTRYRTTDVERFVKGGVGDGVEAVFFGLDVVVF
jgi:hypothetical protein